MSDVYKTLAAPSVGEYKDRGSKFLAYAFPAEAEEAAAAHLAQVRKQHPKARHYCYAYRFGTEGLRFRANDDGEPSGTAGRPILGQIDSAGVTNVLVVVVRYFGGTKLGASGLIQAYKLSAADALQQAEVVERTIADVYELRFGYELMGEAMNAVKRLKLEVVRQEFEEAGLVQVAIRQSESERAITQLKALIAKVSVEEAKALENIAGLQIEYITTR